MPDELEPPTNIGNLEEWRLFKAIWPLFKLDHPWVALNNSDTVNLKKQADLLKAHITEIPLTIPADHTLTEEGRKEFELNIGFMLVNLQYLVDRKTISENDRQSSDTAELTEYSPDMKFRFPDLLFLEALLRNHEESSSFAEYGSYLCLGQDYRSFQRIRQAIEKFLKETHILLKNEVPLTAQTHSNSATWLPTTHAQNSFNHEFWSYSATQLFEGLVMHFKECDETQIQRKAEFTKHKAMLRLNKIQVFESNKSKLEVGLMLASCPGRENWHQKLFTISSERRYNSSTKHKLPAEEICNGLPWMQQDLEFQGNSFQEVSSSHLASTDINADPTKKLSDLLDEGILKGDGHFSNRDKEMLALTLAYALLQLHGGPWIQSLWTMENLFFKFDEESGIVHDIDEPYISCILSENPPAPSSLDKLHRFPLILSFAKTLIELETGEIVNAENHRKVKTPSLLFACIKRYEALEGEKLDDGYINALKACLNFSTHLKRAEQENEEVIIQDVIFNQIVLPLETRFKTFEELRMGRRNLSLGTQNPVLPQRVKPTPNNARTQSIMPQSQASGSNRGNTKRFRSGSSILNPIVRTNKTGSSKFSANPQTAKRLASERTTGKGNGKPTGQHQELATANPPSQERRYRPRITTPANQRPSDFKASSKFNQPPSSRQSSFEGSRRSTPDNNRRDTPVFVKPSPAHPIDRGQLSYASNNAKGDDMNVILHPSISEFGERLSSNSNMFNDISTMSFDFINNTVAERLLHQDDDRIIRVAILDTGFDVEHDDFKEARTKHFQPCVEIVSNPVINGPPQFRVGIASNPVVNEPTQCERIKAYRNFCHGGANGDLNGTGNDDDIKDFDGHGTKVAGIILRLAPHAELFIARVCMGESNVLTPEDLKCFQKPQPEIVARAVRWAIEKRVDIINLSLGFRQYSSEQMSDVKKALLEAQEKKIIVFAATSNEGLHDGVAWPANDSRFAIGVHSCTDGGGTKSDFTAVPSSSGANFMVVGENILSQQLTSKGGGFCLCAGSSFATPVATAIGAIILAFVWQTVCYEEREDAAEDIDLEDIHANHGMIKVLKAISKQPEKDYWSLSTKIFWADYYPNAYDDESEARKHAWRIIIRALRA